jgi:UDP-glucuronate 4-epimerase
MTVIVTGAAGFIGFNLCLRLAKEGHEVIAVDSFSDYYSPIFKELRVKELRKNSNITFRKIDLLERPNVESLISTTKPQSVIHLAAQAGVRLPESQFYKYVDANLTAFSNILNSTIGNQVPDFLYASSSSVYGNSEKYPFSESDSNLNPISFYGATKLSNEILAASRVRGSGSRVRGLRFFTVYGPWGRPDMAYFRIAANLISGAEFRLFGNGSIRRDFTYIDDVIESVFRLSNELKQNPIGFSDVVNVGGGKPASVLELIQAFEQAACKNLHFRKMESFPGDVKETVSDTSYQESIIGFVPKIDLIEGATKFLDWALEPGIVEHLDEWIRD